MQISDEMLEQTIQELVMSSIKQEGELIPRWRRMVISLPNTKIRFWWRKHLDGTYEADEIKYTTRLSNNDLYAIINEHLQEMSPAPSRRLS